MATVGRGYNELERRRVFKTLMLVLRVRESWVSVQGCAKLPMKQRKDWNEKVVKDSKTRPIMSTARASSSNFERSCNSKLFQSWWSCQYRRLRCSADLAARGAVPFVLMKFNQWRQRLNFTVPSCTVHVYSPSAAAGAGRSPRIVDISVVARPLTPLGVSPLDRYF